MKNPPRSLIIVCGDSRFLTCCVTWHPFGLDIYLITFTSTFCGTKSLSDLRFFKGLFSSKSRSPDISKSQAILWKTVLLDKSLSWVCHQILFHFLWFCSQISPLVPHFRIVLYKLWLMIPALERKHCGTTKNLPSQYLRVTTELGQPKSTGYLSYSQFIGNQLGLNKTNSVEVAVWSREIYHVVF